MKKKHLSLIVIFAMMFSVISFSPYYYSGAEGFTTLTWKAESTAFNFDISEGEVTIADGTDPGTYKVTYGDPQTEHDNIPQDQTITLWGAATTANLINVIATEGTVKISLDGLETTGGMRLSSNLNRDVEIVLADGSDNIIRNSLSNASPDNGGGLVITCEHANEPGHICM